MRADKCIEKTVIFIGGSEDMLRIRFLGELLSAAKTGQEDFDLESFTADSRPLQDWIGSAGTAPFLSERRTVIVRNLLRSSEHDAAKAQLKTLPKTALVILVADDETSDESKQRSYKRIEKEWAAAVQSAGGAVCLFESDPKSLRALISKEIAAHGKSISSRAIEAFAEMCGGSQSAALSEIEKLVLYVGEEKAIREEDVRASVVASHEWNVFRMVDAALAGNPAEAQKQLRILVGSAKRIEEAAQINIFPVLSKQLKLVWQAKACIEAGAPNQIPTDLAAQFPEKPNLANEAEWSKNRALRTAHALDRGQISACFKALSDADSQMKGQLPAHSAMDTLEVFLLKIAAISRKPADARTRT